MAYNALMARYVNLVKKEYEQQSRDPHYYRIFAKFAMVDFDNCVSAEYAIMDGEDVSHIPNVIQFDRIKKNLWQTIVSWVDKNNIIYLW